ncbi:MAG TPA: hypothetical protein IAC31_06105 [Candidatus Faecousia intestinigallinarum]|nr:hypothetical protein [Candidatus Faecousia intestinigallinarum]
MAERSICCGRQQKEIMAGVLIVGCLLNFSQEPMEKRHCPISVHSGAGIVLYAQKIILQNDRQI